MINLLKKTHDIMTDKFIIGLIDYEAFEKMEQLFIKNSKLFTICMN
jgi:hypothetical protein